MIRKKTEIRHLIILFLLLSISLLGTKKIEELESTLSNMTGLEKARNLSLITEFYCRKNPKKAIEYGNEALLLLKTISDKKTKISILISLGWAYKDIGEYKLSLSSSLKSLELSNKTGNEKTKAISLNIIGINQIFSAKYADSLNNFRKSLKIFRQLGIKKEIASTLNNMGITYEMTGSYELALNYYLQSLKIKEETGEFKWIASTLNNIGVLYNLIDFPDKAIQYFNRALKINRKLNRKNSIAISLTNIGNIYYRKKEYKKSLDSYFNALKIDKELGNKRGISNSLNNIGLTLSETEKLDEALKYYKRALNIREKLDDKRAVIRTLLNIAEVNIKEGFYKEAIKKLNIVLETAKTINAKDEIAASYEKLYTIYEKKKDNKKAFNYLKKLQILNKKIIDKKSREKVVEMETRYQLENKEKELELLKKNELIQQMTIKRQRFIKNVFFTGSFLLLIGIIILFYLYRSKSKINNKLETANKKLDIYARTDLLTGLSNRRDMYEMIEYEQNRIARVTKPFSLVICDIDHFKSFNDTYGHDCGDFILKELAKRLSSLLRKQDTIGRWGGEEFLILLPETTLKGAEILSEKIRVNIASSQYNYKGINHSVTLTFGISSYSGKMDLNECLKNADNALYQGKKSGRNCVVTAINIDK